VQASYTIAQTPGKLESSSLMTPGEIIDQLIGLGKHVEEVPQEREGPTLPPFQRPTLPFLGGYPVIPIDDPDPTTGSPVTEPFPTRHDSNLSYFASFAELAEYVDEYSYYPYRWGYYNECYFLVDFAVDLDSDALSMNSFSGTNNQVVGVDEVDSVKTDGRYLYLHSGGSIYIIKAYPHSEARIVSKIENHGGSIQGLFIHDDRLVILKYLSQPRTMHYEEQTEVFDGDVWYQVTDSRVSEWTLNEPQTQVLIYDINRKANPRQLHDMVIPGSYQGARLIGNDLYLITTHRLYRYDDEVNWPVITEDGQSRIIDHTQIGYFDDSVGSSQLTMITSLSVQPGMVTDSKAVLSNSTNHIYVSQSGIYLAGADYGWYRQDGSFIHKFTIDEGQVSYVGMGLVPGWIDNQFAMDEHKGHLRVATTIGFVSKSNPTSTNNLYILDGTMTTVGKLEGLAPGEQIYSARFMGDRGYMVTFKKVDPFFVIDLSDPTDPTMLGYLKIPGYSDYMHPYDENHVIGLGKDTMEASSGNFAWYQGLKLSLFDVTDVAHPKEVSKLIIGDRGTESEALHDHRAFQFFGAHDKIVIPVDLYEVQNPNGRDNQHGEFVWQGAYVISLTLEDGFQIFGRVSHIGTNASQYSYNDRIQRSLYIEDVLYTFSPEQVALNDINNLNRLETIKLE